MQILSVALGWATADLTCNNIVEIVYKQGYLSNAFKMEYIEHAVYANFDIFEIIAMTFIIYTLTKRISQSRKLSIYLMIISRYLFPVILKYTME